MKRIFSGYPKFFTKVGIEKIGINMNKVFFLLDTEEKSINLIEHYIIKYFINENPHTHPDNWSLAPFRECFLPEGVDVERAWKVAKESFYLNCIEIDCK